MGGGEMTAKRAITEFKGTYRFLSNFYPCQIPYEGLCYPSAEHAFAAAKTHDPEMRLKIATSGSPTNAKRLGRSMNLRPDWEAARFTVMAELLRIKFAPGSGLADRLIATGGAELVEGNTWHDQTWGDCHCGRDACSALGDNHLGRELMRVREELSVQTYERIGITASRHGLTDAQHTRLLVSLKLLRDERGAKYLHHGDCQGGDDQTAKAARELGYRIIGHPPADPKLRAFFDSDETREPTDYKTRDRALVNEVDLLIGCPDTAVWKPRSGTWYTITYARGAGTKVAVIGPDGNWVRDE
jgi:ribA/ribD-fused uncharacterized protein